MEECNILIKGFGGAIAIICNQIVGSDLGTVRGDTIGGSLGYREGTLFVISEVFNDW